MKQTGLFIVFLLSLLFYSDAYLAWFRDGLFLTTVSSVFVVLVIFWGQKHL